MPVKEGIIQILNDSQSSLHNHQKLLRKLKALYEQHQNVEDFFETFFLPFTNALVIYKREPAVERVIDFVAKFAVSTAPTEKQDSDTCSENGEGEEGDKSEEEEEEIEVTFFSLLLDKLLSIHQARDKAVRFRVCQLIAKMMNYAADAQTKIGPDRLDRVQEVMMHRLYDKIPVVRCHAAASLEFFQDPSPQCPVVKALLELMGKDSSPDVRRTILSKIAVTNRTLSAVIERTRDVKEVIRHEAFLWLANKCSIRHLTIEERIQLLNDGLNDHSEVVLEACVNGMLRNWSLECMNGDFITLLSRLDVESSQQVVELALTKLFDNFNMEELSSSMVDLMVSVNTKPEVWGETPEKTPTQQQRPTITPSKSVYGGPGGNDSFTTATPQEVPTTPSVKLIPLELLRCEEAFYWRCLCHYLHGKGVKGDEWLENIVPTVTEMCDYIERYVHEVLLVQEDMESSLQCQFVTQQLCSTLAVMDSSDEAGRRRIAKLVCDLLSLPRLPASLVEHLLAEQTKIWPQETFRIEKLTEVIAELRHPSSLSQPTSNPVAESTQILPPPPPSTMTPSSSDDTAGSQSLTTTILPFLGGEDSQMSANISVLELRDDADTLYKCLCIACEMLKELQIKKLSPTLQTLVDTLLIPCIQNENPYVRDMALLCLGLACIVDLHMARKHLLLFLQVSQVDHESVQATALKVVFDLLHIYGFEAFNIGKPGEPASAAKTTEQNEGEVDTAGDRAPVEERETVEGDGDRGEEAGGQREEEDGSDKSDEITQRILNIMANFLEGESSLLREVAGQGIAKLLLSGRIMSRKLLAKLLVLWYNPITQEESTLRNSLGTFFPAFAAADRRHREFLGEVYLPVMKTLLEAPPTSPLTEIDVGNVADLIVQLTKPTGPSEDSVHDSLAIAVANEILSDPDTTDVRLYCRSLTTMELTPTNQSNAGDLLVLWEKMCQEVKDRTSRRYLDKFGALLKKIKPDYTSPEPAAVAEGGANSPVATATATGTQKGEESTVKPKRTRGKSTGVKAAKAKTTGKKQTTTTTAAVKTARTGQRQTTQRKTRRRGVRFEQDESSEESDENFDPDDIANLPKCVTSVRLSKRVASRRLVEDGVRAALAYSDEGEGEQSDDSLVGEHSPFVKHTRNKRTDIAEPLKPLQYSEEANY